jgi:acetyl esterase/lipase
MNEMVQKYQGAPWLKFIDTPPLESSLKAIADVMAKEAEYPLSPGNELYCFDYSTPDTMTLEDIKTPAGTQIWLYTPKGYSGKKLFYYIHGGGFMRGNGPWCRHNAIALVQEIGVPVAAVEYHYTPEYKYPVALNDCDDAYKYLTETRQVAASDLIMGGESAGGTFTMAMAVRLKAQGRPLPSALVNSSAYLDFSLEGDSYSKNLGVDPTFTMDMHPSVPFYLADMSKVKDPEVSPIFGDYAGFPPTFWTVDETEIFLSDALRGADKLHKAGVPTEAYITHGFVHVFLFEAPEIPESKALYAEIKAFLQKHKAI